MSRLARPGPGLPGWGRRLLGPLPAQDTPEFTYRRGALLALLGCGLLVSLCTLALASRWGFSRDEQVALGVIMLKNAAFIGWLWRRPHHFLGVGLTELALEAVTAHYRLHVTLNTPPDPGGLGGYAPWMVMTYLTAFVVLPGRAALGVSAAQFGGLLLTAATAGTARGPLLHSALGNSLLQTFLVHATFIAFLSVQQRLLHHYAHALTNARHEALLAHVDVLTGLPNRRQLSRWLRGALETPQGPLSVVLFDLDHFKRVNDTFGHDAGDHVLQEVARLLRRSVRGADRVGRWGGEEFLILVDGDAAVALAVAGRLQQALRLMAPGPVGAVTVSCGVAQAAPNEGPEALLRRADEALYAAKRAGRDTVELAG